MTNADDIIIKIFWLTYGFMKNYIKLCTEIAALDKRPGLPAKS